MGISRGFTAYGAQAKALRAVACGRSQLAVIKCQRFRSAKLQKQLAVIAAGFTLVMSNIGATVILVPIAINIALASGADPAMFALTVAISTSNSFLIPTHQVNALIMGPGDYRVTDFVRAGSVMTVIFIVVSLIVLNLIF